MDRKAGSMIGCHGRSSQSRRERSKRAASAAVSLPTSLAIKVGWTVYNPRFAAVGTLRPAAAQSVSTNSPASNEMVLLVRGTRKTSWEECGALTTTAGLTFALDKSEKGYRTRTMSFLE